MTVSALVLTLDAAMSDLVASVLAEDVRLTLGAAIDTRLPVVAETTSARAGVALVEELQRTPGVLHVDVVSIDFSGDDE